MNTIIILSSFIAFLGAFIAALSIRPRRIFLAVSLFFTVVGLTCSAVVFVNRYLEALPMMPMHLGINGIICILALTWCLSVFFRLFFSKEERGESRHNERMESVCILLCLSVLSLAIVFFPKDFYLPFPRSLSIWAHIFLVFGIIAKGLLLYGGILPLASLLCAEDRQQRLNDSIARPMKYIIWGYGFLALSMFSGEIWSYLGWGTPVVWHDAAITTIIALWFYWTCFLHLHYMKRWTARKRMIFMVICGLLVLILGAHPDMGPFRMVHLG